jgi:hypothetical protein
VTPPRGHRRIDKLLAGVLSTLIVGGGGTLTMFPVATSSDIDRMEEDINGLLRALVAHQEIFYNLRLDLLHRRIAHYSSIDSPSKLEELQIYELQAEKEKVLRLLAELRGSTKFNKF